MNADRNLVKKEKREEDEFEEEEDIELEEDIKPSRTHQESAKKKMITLMGIILIGTVILLLFLYIISLFTTRKYEYSDIEEILQKAAISYFKDYPDSLPKEDGSIVEIDHTNLVAAGKMKDLVEYTGDGVSCSASVQVEKISTDYVYTPFLNCGDDYSTTELYKKVLQDDLVSSGDGLYSNNGNYIYRGEHVNNYVKLDESLWRIVKVTSDNNIVLISDPGISKIKTWDDRYNETTLYSSGINSYSVSRIKEYLDKLYSGKNDDEEVLFSNKDRSRMAYHKVCIGKRSKSSESKDNSIECKEVLNNQKLSLLTLSDYMYASIDPNCKNADTKSCRNYNYLVSSYEWWLATGDSDTTTKVYKIESSGSIKSENASMYACVRPVIYLNDKVLFKGGKGTLEKPYTVK